MIEDYRHYTFNTCIHRNWLYLIHIPLALLYLIWKFNVLMQYANMKAKKAAKPTKTPATGPMKLGS